MSGFTRCTICRGFLHHSYNTDAGIQVYRCNGEDSWNDKGRYFIFAAGGVIEVEPTSERRGKGRSYNYSIVDTENRRRKKDADDINADLEARQESFRKSVLDMFTRAQYLEKYAPKEE